MEKICILICFILIGSAYCIAQEEIIEPTESEILRDNSLSLEIDLFRDLLIDQYKLTDTQIEALIHFLNVYGAPKSYLDLQSLGSIEKDKALLLYSLFSGEDRQGKSFEEKAFMVYMENENWDSSIPQQMKYRLKYTYKNEQQQFSFQLEKDKGEKTIINRYPYFSDHFSASMLQHYKRMDLFLGAFEYGMGQGLCIYQPLNFGLGNSFVQSEQKANKLRVKSNFDEDRFMNGIGLHLKGKTLKPLIILSSRLLDGSSDTYTPWPSIKTGGRHVSLAEQLTQNNIHQLDLILSTEIQVQSHLKVYPSYYRSYRKVLSPTDERWSSKSWGSIAYSINTRRLSYFGELAAVLNTTENHAFIFGLKYNLRRKSGLSYQIKHSGHNFKAYQPRDFSNSIKTNLLHQHLILDLNLGSSRMLFLKYESISNQLQEKEQFSLRFEKLKRKQWTFRSQLETNIGYENERTMRLKFYYGMHKPKQSEYRFRLQFSQHLSGRWSPAVLLAADLLIKSQRTGFASKTRIAFCKAEESSLGLYAYENAPSGQYSIYNYNQSGLRLTQNFKFKFPALLLELKLHRWIPQESVAGFPLEIQLKHLIREE